ncbi:hypothetical protein DMC30DRAFT_89643 [Rhodotorula diobovata]|uniref:Yeast cell wall synthesis Kre9/Knh1-like N-terminal domain-containing protein n=1 Tax=Rhodotorula diobovata TaxID=5288 RepID=A0A5C5FM08_9BASI|nr:hypothetical protein DMC30DRAFT_89643 [Rhodotorula diobovata]
MHFSTALASFAALALSAPAVFANPYIYKPVEASHYRAGDSFTVSWRDNGEAPLSSAYGQTTVSLYTGSSLVQTEIAALGTVADPSTDTEVLITIDPTWGPDSDDYFIRIQSVAGVDSTGAPLQAFSARFALSQMTGTWSSTASAALAGSPVAAAAASASATSPAAAAAASTMATSVRAAATSAPAASVASLESKVAASSESKSASASGAQASASGTSGTEGRVVVGGVVGLVGVAAVLALV